MRVLVGCEFSGRVRDCFARRGHDAWSCDFKPTLSPGNHLQCDVLSVLDRDWDLLIVHPDCTYLCSSGLHWNRYVESRRRKTKAALGFVRKLLDAKIGKIALENPVGCIGTKIRPADQIIQPHEFGENASKQTGLWLKNLPLLRPTKYVKPRMVDGKPRWGNQTDSGQNNPAFKPVFKRVEGLHNKPILVACTLSRAEERSLTYWGVARAMGSSGVDY